MSALHHNQYIDPPDIYGQIASDIRHQGWSVIPDALPAELAQGLFNRVMNLEQSAFDVAGIGRDQQHQLNRFVRQDEIRWLTGNHPQEAGWLEWTQGLQQSLNRMLFLGLFSYESHFAHYPKGGFYRKHLDAFAGQSSRILSTVLYLNPGWMLDQGGEMVLYSDQHPDQEIKCVLPVFNTLAVFLSEEFPHEVLPAQRDRYSIAGWFRVNSSSSDKVDPPR